MSSTSLRVRSGPRRNGESGADALVLVQADGGLGQGVGVGDQPDRGPQTVQRQRLAEVHSRILRAHVRVVYRAVDRVLCRDRSAAAWRIADSTNRVSLLVAASQPMIVPAKASMTNAT